MVLLIVKEIRFKLPYIGIRKLYKMLNNGHYGIPVRIGRDALFKLLRDNDMLSRLRKRYRKTTNSKHSFPSYPNLLKEKTIEQINEVWVSDITYIRLTGGKFCYLFLTTDYYSRKIIGYALKTSLSAEGALEAFDMAHRYAKPPSGFIHHSDHGIQYCCKEFVSKLLKNNAQISMTGKDHCYDNAVAERVNGILKQEFGLGKELSDIVAARKLTIEGINLYNNVRLHVSLEYRTPGYIYSRASISLNETCGDIA